MSGAGADDGAASREELAHLRAEHAALSAEVARLRAGDVSHLRARLVRTALVVGVLAALAAGAVYQFRGWFL